MAKTIRARYTATCKHCKRTIHSQRDYVTSCKVPGYSKLAWIHQECARELNQNDDYRRKAEQFEKERAEQFDAKKRALFEAHLAEHKQAPEPAKGENEGQGEAPPIEGIIRKIANEEANDVFVKGGENLLAKVDEAVAKAAENAPARTLKVQVNEAPEVEVELAHPAFEDCVALAAQRLNILLVGPSGCGKTFLGKQVADALVLPFATISCTVGMSEGQLLGRLLPTGEAGRFEYHSAPFVDLFENGGVFLLDEVDAADENTLLTLNQGLANGRLPLPHRTDKPVAERHPDFVCIAAANTFGTGADRVYVGRNQLDDATLDRFRIGTLNVDYSDDIEKALCPDESLRTRLQAVREKVREHKLRRVVSTRFLEQAQIMRKAGWSEDKCVSTLTSGWTEDERKVVQ